MRITGLQRLLRGSHHKCIAGAGGVISRIIRAMLRGRDALTVVPARKVPKPASMLRAVHADKGRPAAEEELIHPHLGDRVLEDKPISSSISSAVTCMS